MSIFDLISNDSSEKMDVVYGVAVGIVTNTKDPEKLGRVKVKILTRDENENETDWIRVASLSGGKNRGHYFLPEIDDEVLIAFNGGDPHKPYMIGVLWNSKDLPPEKNEDGKNNIKMIKTRSGHQIIFNEEEGKESIDIHTPKKLTLKFDDEHEVIQLKDSDGKNKLKIDCKKGEVILGADKKVTINAGSNKVIIDGNSNSITIESSTSLKIKSQQINIEAGGTMTIKSGGMLDIKSDGVLNIKGAMVKIN